MKAVKKKQPRRLELECLESRLAPGNDDCFVGITNNFKVNEI